MQTGHSCEHGADVYSYETCIRTQTANAQAWIFNVTKYSKTTSKHQTRAFDGIEQANKRGEVHVIRLSDVPQGTSAEGLRELVEIAGRLS